MEEAAGFHPLTHLSHRAGEGCQVSGGVLISRVPGSLRLSAQSPQSAHSFDPLMMNASHHVSALLFIPPLFDRASAIEWSSQLTTHSMGAIIDPGEAALREQTFLMTEQAGCMGMRAWVCACVHGCLRAGVQACVQACRRAGVQACMGACLAFVPRICASVPLCICASASASASVHVRVRVPVCLCVCLW